MRAFFIACFSPPCQASEKNQRTFVSQWKNLVSGQGPLFIRQIKEMVEIFIDFETKNKYEILDQEKNQIGFIAERDGGFWGVVKRWFLRSHRPLEVDVFNAQREKVLLLSRPFFWMFSDLYVQDHSGQKVGRIHRRFGILYKKYDLYDAQDKLFARIKSPLWRLWTFPIRSPAGEDLGVISKKWSGFLKEIFTDADMYMFSMEENQVSEDQKLIGLAAAISIDFDYFENNQGKQGLFSGD